MTSTTSAYGLWSLVIVNSIIFILFAYTFFKPCTGRDWRSFGAFSAFLVALSTSSPAGFSPAFPASIGSRMMPAISWR